MAQTVSLLLSAQGRAGLEGIVEDRRRPVKQVQRARIILLSGEHRPVLEIAKRVGVSRPMVWRWQRRYAEEGPDGLLRDKTRPRLQRIGQKNTISRRWAKRGSRPRAAKDPRTMSAYLFGAVCPAKGKGAGLVMPWCETEAMSEHLEEISAAVDPGCHAVLILDQVGWHGAAALRIPANITRLPLPARSPELNPMETIWPFMRDNWLSNRIVHGSDDIVGHGCDAWNKLIDQPRLIISIANRAWAHQS